MVVGVEVVEEGGGVGGGVGLGVFFYEAVDV